MKILYILDLYKPHNGGVEILFENLISGVINSGNQAIILTSRFDKNLPKYEKISDNLEIYRVGKSRYDFMFFCLSLGIKLAKSCDIIHTTTYNSAIPAWFIARFSNKKVILTVHEIFGQLWYKFLGIKGFFFKLFESMIFRFSFDKYICVSNYTKNSLRVHFGIDDKRLITVYNGIDYSIWDKNTIDNDMVLEIRNKYELEKYYVGLFFGRAGISKGLRFYLESIPRIIAKIPNFKAFFIVSESKNNQAIIEREIIKKLNIENNIIWINGVDYIELKNYIIASDFVVVPSLAEGFGFAAAETCALNKQLVVTNIGSLPEVVSGKINFVEPSNSDSILEAVLKFKNGTFDEIERKRFEWKDNIDKTLEIYKSI